MYSEKKYNINEKFDFNKEYNKENLDKKKNGFKIEENDSKKLSKKEIYNLLDDDDETEKQKLETKKIIHLLDDNDTYKLDYKFDENKNNLIESKNDVTKNTKKINLGYNQNFEELSEDSQNSFSNIYSNLATIPPEDYSYKLKKTKFDKKDDLKIIRNKKKQQKISMSEKKKKNYSDDILTQNIKFKPLKRTLIKIKNKNKKKKKKEIKKNKNQNSIINSNSLKNLNKNEKEKINPEEFFKDNEFYIADNFFGKKKNEIKKLIEKYKGIVVSNVLNSTDFIISDKVDLRTTTLVQLYEKSALNENFIIECVKNKKVIKKILKCFLTVKYQKIN